MNTKQTQSTRRLYVCLVLGVAPLAACSQNASPGTIGAGGALGTNMLGSTPALTAGAPSTAVTSPALAGTGGASTAPAVVGTNPVVAAASGTGATSTAGASAAGIGAGAMAASAGAAGLLGTAGVAAAGVGAAGVGAAGVGAGAAGAKAAGAGGVSGAGGAKGAGAGGTVVGAGQVAVTIRFKATVGGADFACGQNYMGQGSAGTTVTPQDFRMFVQDLKLIRADGTEVPVQYDKRAPWQSETVALLDFENGSGRCAGEGNPEMNTTITGTVAAGEYTKISFVNGVPDDLNHADPLTLPEPLSKYSALSWSWLIGYRFIKLELAQVSTAGLAFGLGLVHTGNNGSLINRNKIVLSGFDAATSTIAVDAGAVFKGADLSMDWQCHSVESECDPMFKALGINFQTGLPLTTQSAFSVQ